MTWQLGSTMQVLRPAPHVFAFYDGRIDGVRAWSDEPNWLDDGAFVLGCCSYALADGDEALVYDTHMSLAHATLIRRTLEEAGARSIRVVLSHWHADHIAGNEVFRDCEIIASTRTARILAERTSELESGSPPIRPVIAPTRTFEGSLRLRVGGLDVALRCFDIHSSDGTVMLLPGTGTLFAGDTLEDPITFVVEPDRLSTHLAEIDRLSAERFSRILPNHGSPEIIGGGGYGRSLVAATRRYVQRLIDARLDPGRREADLRLFLGSDLAEGHVRYYAPYEAVHRDNLRRISQIGT